MLEDFAEGPAGRKGDTMDQTIRQRVEELHSKDRHEEIVRLLERLETPDAESRSLLARAYNNLGRYEEAERLLLSAPQPEDPLWHFRLGYAWFYQERYEEALREFEETLQLLPGDEDALIFAGWCRRSLEARQKQNAAGQAPEAYTEAERERVLEHIAAWFGKVDDVIPGAESQEAQVDLAVIPPSAEHDCYLLCTVGMGARRMAVPADLVETEPDRAELMIALPSWWQFESEDENWRWPLRWLKIMTRLPWNQHTWLGWGDTVPAISSQHTPGPGMAGILLIHPQAYGSESFHCTLPNGEQVEFYQMVPLYADELDFKLRNGAEALLRYMNEEALEVVDPARESACRYVSVKDFAIPSAQIRPMLRNWKGPAGCIATDRILVDGCRVGYMYREMPDYEEDSGWRFLSGDESDDYLSDPQNSDVYDLNTICNYDTDIIPFLSYPAGSAFERDLDGHFILLDD